jgi:hypothetical protein
VKSTWPSRFSEVGVKTPLLSRLLSILGASLALACGGSQPPAPALPTGPADPALAQIVTTDLEHFWAAYDAGGRNGSASAFQARYLDAASPGLADFARIRNVTARSLAQMVTAYPAYFASVRDTSLALAADPAIPERIRANYTTIKSLYPASVFPPLTLLIGRFSTAGTVSASGLLIGSEFYSAHASTPLDELEPFLRRNVTSSDGLPGVVAHEHAHVLQLRSGGLFTHPRRNLLEQVLLEGGADFVGQLSSGQNFNGWLWSFGLPNEAALWAEFRAEMHGADVSRWLYNQGSATAPPGRPGDLGYFIGYRIHEAYYARQSDKAAALRDIIEIEDADVYLARSGYGP